MMLRKIRLSLELVKFSHSVFALPFALISALVETRGRIGGETLFWIVFCVVMARTAAMAFNRYVDARVDALNPRTRSRHLPAGLLRKRYVLGLTVVCGALFIFGASRLNFLSFLLSAPVLAILFFYSLTKRFTDFTQFFLGIALGLAPLGAAVATLGQITAASLVLGVGVMFWVAGFDLLYALQDLDFDRRQGLHSLAVRLGKASSLRTARYFHGVFFACLIAYGWTEALGWGYGLGVGVAGIFLIYQHAILDDGLRRLNAAFFTANGALSLMLLACVALDLFLLDS